MVDKKNNQREDIENTEDEEQDYESYDDYDENDEAPGRKSNPLPILIILLLLLGVAAFFLVPKFMGGDKNTSAVENNVPIQNNSDAGQNSQSSEDMTDSFFDAAGGDNQDMMSVNFNDNGETNVETGEGDNMQVATVTDMPGSEAASNNDLFENQNQEQEDTNRDEEQENNAIMVVYNKVSKMNPFKPPVVEKTEENPYETVNDTQFEIIEPPVASVPDENLTRLLQTQISGILYDDESPSAIVNLNGMDQFVKQGDTVAGYKIESITKDKVQISYKNNSYVASVGELFTRGSLEKSAAIVNLENKFAGRYRNNN